MTARAAATKQSATAREMLERFLARDPRCRALTRAMRAAQRKLRRAANDEAWEIYLALEELANARHAEIVAAALAMTSRGRSR